VRGKIERKVFKNSQNCPSDREVGIFGKIHFTESNISHSASIQVRAKLGYNFEANITSYNLPMKIKTWDRVQGHLI